MYAGMYVCIYVCILFFRTVHPTSFLQSEHRLQSTNTVAPAVTISSIRQREDENLALCRYFYFIMTFIPHVNPRHLRGNGCSNYKNRYREEEETEPPGCSEYVLNKQQTARLTGSLLNVYRVVSRVKSISRQTDIKSFKAGCIWTRMKIYAFDCADVVC